MNINYKEYMTSDMLEILELTLNEEKLKEEFLYCNKMCEKAKKAVNISLPHTLPNGVKVVHGARMEINKLAVYWENRRNLAGDLLSREWVVEQLYGE